MQVKLPLRYFREYRVAMRAAQFSNAIIAVGILALQSGSTLAHHSRAEFADEVQVLEGVLVGLNWSNPHPTFELSVINEEGIDEAWEVQAFGSMYTLTRGGVTADYFMLGDPVRIAGSLSTRRDRVFLGINILLGSRQEVVLNGGAEPYFNQEGVGGLANWAADESDVVDAETENRGLYRTWSMPNRSAVTMAGSRAISLHLPFNETRLAERAAWDALGDPDMQCMPKGMPAVMITPHPFAFFEDGENIKIVAHEYGVERIIHLDGAIETAAGMPPSNVGYSVGRWEGNTLVVDTNEIAENYFFFGFDIGDRVEVVERITLSADQTRLDYSAVITDPETFTEPARIDRYWLALGETPEPYNCTAAIF